MLDGLALGALNHLLADAPWARERLRPYAGRRARISLGLAPLKPFALNFSIAQDGKLQSLAKRGGEGEDEGEVDIVLPPSAPLAALQGRDAIMRGARVSGAADFAEALSFVLRNLDWDAEEDLSKLVGDIAAKRVVNGARQFVATKKDVVERAIDNLTEYLIYEKPQWLTKSDNAHFTQATNDFAASTSALEQRIAALEKQRR